jgi:DNA-binding protein HU-beta
LERGYSKRLQTAGRETLKRLLISTRRSIKFVSVDGYSFLSNKLAFPSEYLYSYKPSISLKYREEYKLTKADLISAVAEKSGMTKKDSDSAVTAMIDVITETLARGENVALVGFGTFEVRERAARQGINPRTKEPMPIPASKLPAFKAGKAFKEAVEK